MTGMPASLAFLMTAAPESESRLTMSSALTPELIMPSAMLWNLLTSPPAFWMSDWMPAASNACLSSGRSAPSQRAEEAESGRITPTLLPAAAGDDAPPPAAAELELEELEPPQAVRPSRPAALTATSPRKRLRILRSFLGPVPDPGHDPAVAGPAHPTALWLATRYVV